MSRFLLTDVRVFDGTGLRPGGSVAVDSGVIVADAQGAEVVDGHGGVLIPGLIDAHVHLKDASTLEALAAYGVTTALDMGTWPVEKLDPLRGLTGLTDVRSSGRGATSPDSAHAERIGRPPEALVADPSAAAPYVAARVAERVDHIKIIIDLPGFDVATVTALVEAAHACGLRTVAHASTYAAAEMALDAGVDVLTHAPLDRAMDEVLVGRAVQDARVVVPTLTMMEGIVAAIGAMGGVRYEPARASVAALHAAGVPVLAGTDANSAPFVPFSPPHGLSLHHELELLVDAGLSPLDALRAATILPAMHFGLPDRGVVAVGKRADLVLLADDPLAEIGATRSIQRVWCAGTEVTADR